MADLLWMLLTMHALGHGYVVWDEAGEIEFVASGRVRISSVTGTQYFRCAWHCAPLRYQRLVSLDTTFPARAKSTKTLALCGPDDPCIPQGFRVYCLGFDPRGLSSGWAKFSP